MSIEVTCPNGHVLRVKDRHAGQTGLCPKCQARVLVPELTKPQVAAKALNDDAIMGMLGGGDEDSMPVHQEVKHREGPGSSDSTLVSSSSVLKVPKKSCQRCNRDVPGHFTVCPYCRTYLSGILKRGSHPAQNCPHCGMTAQPNDVFCISCGTDLRDEAAR